MRVRWFSLMVSALSLTAVAGTASALELLPRDQMTDGSGWTVNGDADTTATFNYDYSADGIPEAPNSQPGDVPTRGLKFTANEEIGAGQQVTATPTGKTFSGWYDVKFDMWINVNGPFPGGGGGSTEFLGGGVGYDGTTVGRNGALLIVTGDGGSSRDWRMYKDTSEQFIESGQYDVDSNNNFGADLSAHIPEGKTAPALQQSDFPQQTGGLNVGAGGFEWLEFAITANSDAGTANFTVTSANGPISIGTLDSNIGDTVATAGNVMVMYADIFSSISDNAALSFGLVDNFRVGEVIPEPTSAVLLILGSMALAGCGIRRRR